MFGSSSLPGARTTATSAMEGRLKSGALSKMKVKKRFGGGSTVVKPVAGTGAIKQKEILKSAKFGGSSTSAGGGASAISKSLGQRKALGTGASSTTGMGSGLGSSAGADRAASLVAKVTNKLTAAKQKALGKKK